MQAPDTEDGQFHGGSPLTGQKGTPIPVSWLNALLSLIGIFGGETEPPDPALGGVNDLYLCTVTRNFYGPKTAEGWGDPWAQGIVGPTGPQGMQGAAGAAQASYWADLVDVTISMAIAGYDVLYRITAAAAGDLVLTFPTAVGKKNRLIGIKNNSNFNVTCIGSGGQAINDNAEGVSFGGGGDGWIFMSDGANWESVGRM